VASRETEPLPDGLNSEAGVRFAVIPARLKATDCTADEGE
jgi:hypothetical protein